MMNQWTRQIMDNADFTIVIEIPIRRAEKPEAEEVMRWIKESLEKTTWWNQLPRKIINLRDDRPTMY